ncbi:MAG: hypothetical protein M3Q97_06955 [Bacteroidota bacterium]|nr:hypothetical protein [Bacteroidota bacterium]
MKIILLFILSLMLFACNADTDKRRIEVVASKMTEKNVPGYKPVSFDIIDTLYTSFLLTDQSMKLHQLEMDIVRKKIINMMTATADEIEAYDRATDSIHAIREGVKAAYKPSLMGWSVVHTYKSREGRGKKRIETDTVYVPRTAIEDPAYHRMIEENVPGE